MIYSKINMITILSKKKKIMITMTQLQHSYTQLHQRQLH